MLPSMSFENISCLEHKGLAIKLLIFLVAAYNFYVDTVTQVFHGFAENGVEL